MIRIMAMIWITEYINGPFSVTLHPSVRPQVCSDFSRE